MLTTLKTALRPVRARWLRQRAARSAATGLMIGSAAALALVIARRGGWTTFVAWEWSLPLAGLAVGLLWELLSPPSWEAVALVVDARYQLKDRTTTAWSFAQREPLEGLPRLQVLDALQRLRSVDPARVVPRRGAAWLGSAVGLWLVAMLFASLPEPRAELSYDPTEQRRLDEVNRQVAERLEESLLEELRRIAELTRTPPPDFPSIQQLPQHVAERLKELKQPGRSRSETLMTLSEIQAAVRETSRQVHGEVPAAHLQQLSGALGVADSLEGVADSLQSEELAEAAAQLQRFDPQQLAELERQTLAEELKPLVDQWREAGDESLAEAAGPLQESLEANDAVAMRAAADQLAEVLEAQSLRLAVAADLGAQLDQLSEAKSMAASGGGNIAPSDESRETWGRGRAGDPLSGRPSQLQSHPQREQLTGLQGEGPTQRETMRVEATDGQAERPLQPASRSYEQAAEEVLRRESLPLGYRQTIREYFRSIRPE